MNIRKQVKHKRFPKEFISVLPELVANMEFSETINERGRYEEKTFSQAMIFSYITTADEDVR